MSQSNFDERDRQVTIAGNIEDAKEDADKLVEEAVKDKYAALAQALESNEAPEEHEYLVRGAVLKCSCGSHTRKLNLPESHGVYIGENPMVNKSDCTVGDDQNIPTFGVCESEGNPCQKSFGETLRDSFITSLIPGSGAVITARDEAQKILLVKEDGTNVRGYPCTPCIVSAWKNAHGESLVFQCSENFSVHVSKSGVVHSGGGRRRSGELDTGEISGGNEVLHSKGNQHSTDNSLALTEQSFLICAYGGLIEPVTSGQENTDTKCLQDDDLHSGGRRR